MRKVALDLGGKKTTYCEVAGGEVVQRATVSAVESLQSLLGPEQLAATVAIEACREAWYVHDLLTSWGNQVILVDTTRSRQLGIGQHGRKTDRIDAEVLARAVERGGIPMAHVLSPHRRELRRQIGIRRALVQTRANLVTTMRGLAREDGHKLPSSTTSNFVQAARRTLDGTLLDLMPRTHWGVETSHQILDKAFAEDAHPWIEANPRAALVVAILRRIAYTLLSLFRSVTQRSDERRAAPWKTLMSDCFFALVTTTATEPSRPPKPVC